MDIIGKQLGDQCQFTIATMNAVADRSRNLDEVAELILHPTSQKGSPSWFASVLSSRLNVDITEFEKYRHRTVIEAGKQADLCLSVGGDNYCYDPPYFLFAIDREIKMAGRRLVLWGASVEPKNLEFRRLVTDFKRFDMMLVRESLTYHALQDVGFRDNVFLYPDPAFTLAPNPVSLPRPWNDEGVVGINLSPMVMRYEETSGIALQSCANVIGHILKQTRMDVALIPHVVRFHDNDLVPLRLLHEQFRESERVILLDGDYSAAQTKWLISRCRFLICARTHASIAAYSTGVPTLVIGYSVKALGLAHDIFGDSRDLVFPVQKLSESTQLVSAFDALREREQDLRQHLHGFMPGYIQSAYEAAQPLRQLL